jgi:hypothetical protein
MLVGVVFGIFVAMGILNDSVIRILSLESPLSASLLLNFIILGMHVIWLLAKLTVPGVRLRRFALYMFSLVCTTLFFLYYEMVNPISGLLPFIRLVATYGLVVDVVSHTSDRSGFVRYLLDTR